MKTALVGLGRIGFYTHLPELTRHHAFDLCAVVDKDEARLAEVDVRGYTDLEECLKAEKPALVVIASPTHLHKEQTLLCFSYGADVFLDKPMTVSSEEARVLKDAAKAQNRRLMVYQPHRLTEEFETAKAILASGKLGRISQIKRSVHAFRRRADWQAFSEFGGGMLQNYGAHYIDQLLALTGATVTGKFCFTDRVATLGDAEDVVECLLMTDQKILLAVSINQGSCHTPAPWEIYGTYGTAVFDPAKRVFRITRFDPETLPPLEASRSLAAAGRRYAPDETLDWIVEEVPLQPAANVYDHCEAYYVKHEPPFVPLGESVALMELLDSLR